MQLVYMEWLQTKISGEVRRGGGKISRIFSREVLSGKN